MTIFIYLLWLANDDLYVGMTNNPTRRLKDHKEGIGSIWTKGVDIIGVEILWSGEVKNRYQAMLIENKQATNIKNKYFYKRVHGGTLSSKYKKIVTKRAFQNK